MLTIAGVSTMLHSMRLLRHAQQRAHFFVEEALTRTIWLYPLAIDDELRNCTSAHVLDQLVGCARRALDIDFMEGNIVLLEEIFGLTAVATPERSVDGQIHLFILASRSLQMASTEPEA